MDLLRCGLIYGMKCLYLIDSCDDLIVDLLDYNCGIDSFIVWLGNELDCLIVWLGVGNPSVMIEKVNFNKPLEK